MGVLIEGPFSRQTLVGQGFAPGFAVTPLAYDRAMETVRVPTAAEALDALDADLDALQAAGVTPVDVVDARALTVRVEISPPQGPQTFVGRQVRVPIEQRT